MYKNVLVGSFYVTVPQIVRSKSIEKVILGIFSWDCKCQNLYEIHFIYKLVAAVSRGKCPESEIYNGDT